MKPGQPSKTGINHCDNGTIFALYDEDDDDHDGDMDINAADEVFMPSPSRTGVQHSSDKDFSHNVKSGHLGNNLKNESTQTDSNIGVKSPFCSTSTSTQTERLNLMSTATQTGEFVDKAQQIHGNETFLKPQRLFADELGWSVILPCDYTFMLNYIITDFMSQV